MYVRVEFFMVFLRLQLDFGSETWSTDPDRLFSCLQSLVLTGHRQSPVKPTEDHSSTVSRGYIKR